MSSNELHRHVRRGDARRLRELLGARAPARRVDVNAYDENGFTPLMVAVKTAAVDANLVRLLLAHGADVAATSRCRYEADYPVLALALMSGDLHKVEALLEAGADLRYRRAHGYDALIDAVHGRDVVRDSRLLELLRVLIARGAVLDGVTSYHESALRVLSRLGRFDAVALLLEAGADASQLKWTPLMRAVALGSTGEVEALLAAGGPLEEVDFWSRTAWLIAIQTGDIGKAALLRERGASTSARGRCGMPPLFYAIGNHHAAMLRWLLDLGFGIEQTDDFGTTPLIAAVEADDAEGARMLLDAGATIDYERNGQTALSHARSPAIVSLLLDAGADPRFLSQEGRRTLLGFPGDADNDPLADIRADDFLRARTRRFGGRNPEPMDEPFWHAMIRAGVTGYAATQWFKGPSSCGTTPVWCAQRFGQSLTFLPDGRIVQIGGEHEDYYDPDFCIYNDVFSCTCREARSASSVIPRPTFRRRISIARR
ncbi:MAG TPA: ankyrin repeat domain-containing protein [Burkholderiaceae bacterium]|nr:ankyrin repeat domain-containing protein [Burkholderiaceae bacterium]